MCHLHFLIIICARNKIVNLMSERHIWWSNLALAWTRVGKCAEDYVPKQRACFSEPQTIEIECDETLHFYIDAVQPLSTIVESQWTGETMKSLLEAVLSRTPKNSVLRLVMLYMRGPSSVRSALNAGCQLFSKNWERCTFLICYDYGEHNWRP